LVEEFNNGLNVILDFLALESVERAIRVPMNAAYVSDTQDVRSRYKKGVDINAITLARA
jgi:hypothetical protein